MSDLVEKLLKLFEDKEILEPKEIEQELKTRQGLGAAINQLLKEGRLRLMKKVENNALLLRRIPDSEAEKFQGLTQQDMFVYQIVERSANQGVLAKSVRTFSGMQQPIVLRSLRKLISKKLIKTVRSIKYKNQMLYMLQDLTPSKDLTGGVWYDNNEWDSQFVEEVSRHVVGIIRENGNVSINQLMAIIKEKKYIKENLALEDIQQVIGSLVDSKIIRKVFDIVDEDVYSIDDSRNYEPEITKIPCGLCPESSRCYHQGVISPENCPYISKMLDF
ncbi:RNA polymerase iii DNA directed 39kd subunit-related [Anaeramoeba ignava]|uniref:RNA polymerase iii DNA directed 39kd subunit-related n=1 Tax=Anaeramoeba ignava TaxID=1746090 RepID=A0A9Q0R5L6_ANAIG|nr:RNA polymerase iii DNA directed 39kd subunit-related [Anaeramoeba ignava]